MADDRPNLGEVTRRVETVEKRLDGKLDKGVYESDQKATDARHTRSEKDIGQLYERVRTAIWVLLGAIAAGVAADVIRTVRGK